MNTHHEETSQEWAPKLTAEVPIPVLEEHGAKPRSSELPRILAQRAGESRATRRTLCLIVFLLALIAGEILVYVRLPDVTHLVLYKEPPTDFLVEP